MKVIIASDSFKGCLSSAQVADAVAEGILLSYPQAEVVKVPVADGGEGTVEALGAELVKALVSDPLGRPHEAVYGISGETAVIEVAAACGLMLLRPEERNPLVTTTRGVGELILDAVKRGCKHFLIGLGGSATNDGGRGMVEVPGLLEAARGLDFTIACDVDTPFVGPAGASRVFGPQKGASPEDVEVLEQRLQEYALEILEKTGTDVREVPGAGAAGGLGGAFRAYFGAELRRGVDMVLDAKSFDEIISGADLVITGEGRSDFQTAKGKTPSGVLERAERQNIPVVLLSGEVALCPELEAMGFFRIEAATPPSMPLEEALKAETASGNIRAAAIRIMEGFVNTDNSLSLPESPSFSGGKN